MRLKAVVQDWKIVFSRVSMYFRGTLVFIRVPGYVPGYIPGIHGYLFTRWNNVLLAIFVVRSRSYHIISGIHGYLSTRWDNQLLAIFLVRVRSHLNVQPPRVRFTSRLARAGQNHRGTRSRPIKIMLTVTEQA